MREQAKKITVALGFGCLSALLAGFVFQHRDSFFAWEWHRAHGKFEEKAEEKLELAARDFAESQRPGTVCVSKWLGKDEKFLYLAMGCARFRETLGEVRFQGDGNFQPARFRYLGEKIEKMESPEAEAWENSLRRLFPKEAADKFRFSLSQPEFERRGIARMAELGMSTLGQ